jgi:hypothetical protein
MKHYLKLKYQLNNFNLLNKRELVDLYLVLVNLNIKIQNNFTMLKLISYLKKTNNNT